MSYVFVVVGKGYNPESGNNEKFELDCFACRNEAVEYAGRHVLADEIHVQYFDKKIMNFVTEDIVKVDRA